MKQKLIPMVSKYKIAVFDEENKLISSIRRIQSEGYNIHDVYTPYPIHEVLKLLKRKTRLPVAAYFFGLFGAMAVLGFLYYTSVISWPIIYGGKPYNAFPSFIIITIVLTIFTVTIASLASFSAASGQYPGNEGRIFDERATDDKFVIVIPLDKIEEEKAAVAGGIFLEEGAVEVLDKEFEIKKD